MLPLRQQAIRLLARREYSRHELQRKLLTKGWDLEQVTAVLDDLAAEQLQDDTRFVASYVRYRSGAGYGPRRIAAELAERGIKETPQALVVEDNLEWQEALKQVWQKKFANQKPNDFKTRAKQAQFLIYRGFAPEQVYYFLRHLDDD